MASNKLTNPMIMEALQMLMEDGLPGFRPVIETMLNELMKLERSAVLQAEPYERSDQRQGYANGFKNKTLHTRMGPIHLEVPKTRGVSFYPQCLEQGERTERALRLVFAEMYLQGVSTRHVKRVAKELCDLEVSSSQVSRLTQEMDKELELFRKRPLGEIVYGYLDAHYEKVRHGGHVIDIAVLKAVGVNSEGRREVLGVSCSLSEAEIHWRAFLEDLQSRGLKGIKLWASDDHAGLKAALRSVFPTVPWQRCIFHLSQNAQGYAPSKAMKPEIAAACQDIYLAPNLEEAQRRIEMTSERLRDKAPDFCDWLEENMPEGLKFFDFPKGHRKKLRTVNMVERLNGQIRNRTRVAKLFPNAASCLRLVSSILMDQHEEWMSEKRYLTF